MEALTDGDLSTEQLVDHWLAVEQAQRHAVRDAARLRGARGMGGRRVAMLSLEGFTARPRATVEWLLSWMGLRGIDGGDARSSSSGQAGVGEAVGSGSGVADADADAAVDVGDYVADGDAHARASEARGEGGASLPCRADGGINGEVGRGGSSGGSDGDGARWCELPAAQAWLGSVRPRPNERYAAEYTRRLRDDRAALARHEAMCERLGHAVASSSGYTLCPPREDRDGYEQPPSRDAEWWRGWVVWD